MPSRGLPPIRSVTSAPIWSPGSYTGEHDRHRAVVAGRAPAVAGVAGHRVQGAGRRPGAGHLGRAVRGGAGPREVEEHEVVVAARAEHVVAADGELDSRTRWRGAGMAASRSSAASGAARRGRIETSGARSGWWTASRVPRRPRSRARCWQPRPPRSTDQAGSSYNDDGMAKEPILANARRWPSAAAGRNDGATDRARAARPPRKSTMALAPARCQCRRAARSP